MDRTTEAAYRPLQDRERAVLDALLAFDVPDAAALRLQASTAKAQRTCACGCPTIGFSVDPGTPRAAADYSPWLVEGRSEDGPVDILLFVRDGRLADMEFVPYDGDPPAEWPEVSRFEFWVTRPLP